MAEVKLHPDWLARIGGEFDQPYMAHVLRLARTEPVRLMRAMQA